ncbi:hypothetical protein ACOQFO_07100 [Ureibacillus sp. MALMAid1270]|uniref:hypothetical protein n=1 Tax=Ureibacillus sp. MALMAid1270 TaxID=3411629 RepID=UPI003BA7B00D
MNIRDNQEKFLDEISLLKQDLISTLNSVNVEKFREEYKGRFSSERFKEYFVEKAAIHTVLKYVLIRMIEESMARVRPKLNEDGLKIWHEMSKNFRKDYNLLFDFAINDVKREQDLGYIFKDTIYDDDAFGSKSDGVLNKHIPILARYNFSTLDENSSLTLIDSLFSSEKREELQNFYEPSPIVNFLLQQLGLI